MRDERPVSINISGIPVAGIGGLGLVAMAALVAIVMPAARWTIGAGLTGGAVLAVALVVARRYWKGSGPSGDDPAILFRSLPPEGGSHGGDERNPAAGPHRELRTANC